MKILIILVTLRGPDDRANGQYDYWKVVAKEVGGTASTFSWNRTTDK